MITLLWPWLLSLLPLPLLLRRIMPAAAVVEEAALRVPDLQRYAIATAHSFARIAEGRAQWWLAFIAWGLLVIAAAQPVWQGAAIELPVSGRDLLLAVDLSGSMSTADFSLKRQQVSRLEAVKAIAGDFIERRVGDRLGLILFGLNAYVQAPLSFDRKTIDTLLQESAIGLAGQQTAIGDAIGLAVKELRRYPHSNKILILLTDGANDAGAVEPLEAAKLAAKEGMTIYTIGIGADEMLVQSLFGVQRVNPSQDLDEGALRAIAQATGGRYFRARDSAELNQIYSVIDQLQPIARNNQTFRPQRNLFFWPLSLALLLAAVVVWRQARAR